MMDIFLASIIAFNAFTINFTEAEQEIASHHLIETSLDSIQALHDSQALIEKLYPYVNKEGLNEIPAYLYSEAVEFHSIGDLESEVLPPGTLIFLGESERNMHDVVLCLADGQCGHLCSQNGNTIFSLCHLTDLDFSQFPYYAVCRASDVVVADESDVEYLNFDADSPAFLNEKFDRYFVNEDCLPFVLTPKDSEMTLANFKIWAEVHQNELKSLMDAQGAVLLRGFPINSAEDFATVVKAVIGRDLIDYKGEGSRKRIAQGVYTSTEAPSQFKIPLHNELTCTLNPVDYICFYCDIAPEPGTGQTILAKTEDITIEMMKRPHIWNLFNGKIIKYISRHPSEGSFFTRVNPTHKTWQQAFETTDREEVARICEQKGYDFKWDGDWIEVTRCVPAIRGPDQYFDHPYWFNQAYLYHANPRIRGGWVNHQLANLLYILPSTRQYDIEFEDGSAIDQEVIYEIYDILDEKTIKFNWAKGDVLLLDNRQTLHGRTPCIGQRRILATMIQ